MKRNLVLVLGWKLSLYPRFGMAWRRHTRGLSVEYNRVDFVTSNSCCRVLGGQRILLQFHSGLCKLAIARDYITESIRVPVDCNRTPVGFFIADKCNACQQVHPVVCSCHFFVSYSVVAIFLRWLRADVQA